MNKTTTMIPLMAKRFLHCVEGVSFARVGICTLIISHMVRSEYRDMTREEIHAAVRTKTSAEFDLVDSVINEMFQVDVGGNIFSNEVERVWEACGHD